MPPLDAVTVQSGVPEVGKDRELAAMMELAKDETFSELVYKDEAGTGQLGR